jgi:secreted Zn-dependent insulinase-like peptidase
MSVGTELTPAGLDKSDEVIESIFAYINMVNAKGIPQYLLQEAQILSEVYIYISIYISIYIYIYIYIYTYIQAYVYMYM